MQFSRITEAYDAVLNGFTPTREWLSEAYSEFNKTVFGNRLPNDIVLYIPTLKSMTALGEFLTKYDYVENRFVNSTITLTDKFSAPKRVYEDVLLHEMIHLENAVLYKDELLVNGVPDEKMDSHYTKCFVSEMKRINRDFGRNISIFTDISDTSKFKVSDTYMKRIDVFKNHTKFFCIHIKKGVVRIYRVDTKNNGKLVDEIANTYGGYEIETVVPHGKYTMNDEYSKTIDDFDEKIEGADFEEFKRRLLIQDEIGENAEKEDDGLGWTRAHYKNGMRVVVVNGEYMLLFP